MSALWDAARAPPAFVEAGAIFARRWLLRDYHSRLSIHLDDLRPLISEGWTPPVGRDIYRLVDGEGFYRMLRVGPGHLRAQLAHNPAYTCVYTAAGYISGHVLSCMDALSLLAYYHTLLHTTLDLDITVGLVTAGFMRTDIDVPSLSVMSLK